MGAVNNNYFKFRTVIALYPKFMVVIAAKTWRLSGPWY